MKNLRKTKLSIAVVSLLMLPACGTMAKYQNAALSGAIADNAIRLSRAHNQTINALIFENILLSRDRMPTNYATVSGMTSNPTNSQTGTTQLSPLGLGNPRFPFQSSQHTQAQAATASLSYSVNPFSQRDTASSIVSPVPAEVFEYYFDRWPKDVIFMLFVDHLVIEDGDGLVETIHNRGKKSQDFVTSLQRDIFIKDTNITDFDLQYLDLKTTSDVGGNCATLSGSDGAFFTSNEKAFGILNTHYNGSVNISHKTLKDGNTEFTTELCPTRLELGLNRDGLTAGYSEKSDRKISIKLRSFDAMVYYIGETLRQDSENASFSVPSCHKNTVFAGNEGNKVPLFKTFKSGKSEHNYSGPFTASIIYNDEKISVGPNQTEYIKQTNECLPSRTSTVMAVLSQILLLNQSSDFLEAPETILR